jgi:outer membrane protein assembly factor BamB/tRNA A-37 threonylcarbamoyl transferase component Bud32
MTIMGVLTNPKRKECLDTHRISENLDTNSRGTDQQLQPGTTLANRYLIQGVVGVGGMGAVYRARDLHFPNVTKLVAVKEMVNQARDPVVRETIVRNFEREANLLATISHPSIPRIYDYFTNNERSYLILEFIDGKDLEALINDTQGFFPEVQVVTWAIELCDVLTHLHEHKPEPIVFRDMKPSNIMVNSRGHIVLVDFGIAKTFQSGTKGTMIGTEGYSPPEQYKGEAGPLADIYALGATLHHVLTRRDPRLEPPFSFGERPIRSINPSVTLELETVINNCLQYNPQSRFPSSLAMKEALLGAARKTGMLPQVTASSATISQSSEGTKLLWNFECEDEVRGTPTVSNGVLYIGSYDNNLYALNAGTGEFIWKYPTDGGVVSKPAILEGNVFFGSEDKRLHVVSTRSGKVIWTYFTEGAVRSSPFLAEGHIFIGSDDSFLHAVNAISSRRSWRMDAGAPIRSTPIVHNELVYFGTENGEFFALDLGGEIRWRFKAKRAITSSTIVAHGSVYFTSVDSTLYALDAKTGFVIWRFRLGKPSISTPCIAENYVFTGATDGSIYCVDSRSAKEVWRFSTEHQVTGSPIIYKDSLYCGSVDGFLYCLEYRTGRMRWKYNTGRPVTGSPTAYEDIIYVGSTNNRVYALVS